MYFVFAYIFIAYIFCYMYQDIQNLDGQGPYLQSIYTP